MGCGSSKSTKKYEEKPSEDDEIDDTKQESKDGDDRNRLKSKRRGRSRSGARGPGGESDLDFEEIVIDAFRNKFEFATMNDIEEFICERSGLSMDNDRRKIIQKVMSDAFYRGCIAVRTINRN